MAFWFSFAAALASSCRNSLSCFVVSASSSGLNWAACTCGLASAASRAASCALASASSIVFSSGAAYMVWSSIAHAHKNLAPQALWTLAAIGAGIVACAIDRRLSRDPSPIS
ncbi:MAG: hypothetical protein B7Z73_04525 [Planctomycetia bacterium 21-64-5]|nr:MAG: hypothetical protein B7Z73_04525 [Planctomycetia bacterium 21-64-5]